MLSKNIDLVSGGPAWLKTDMWDLQASLPEGLFSNRPANADPKLLQMLQALLAERFKLEIRRESREVPVYLLKVGPNGPKFNGRRDRQGGRQLVRLDRDGKPLPEQESPPPPNGSFQVIPRRLSSGTFTGVLEASNVSMESWAQDLMSSPGGLDRPVLDRTGLTGRFDFHFISEVPIELTNPDRLDGGIAGVKRGAVKAIGFELEESRAPFEVLVIERAEPPSEN
jgi:uncharacterized protein (TIGR03435 family)